MKTLAKIAGSVMLVVIPILSSCKKKPAVAPERPGYDRYRVDDSIHGKKIWYNFKMLYKAKNFKITSEKKR